MKSTPTPINGLCVLQPRVAQDHRGSFVKTYHEPTLKSLGVDLVPREEFFSVSRKNVVRGMHFQTPPMAQAKIVYCIAGGILDVAVDLRKASPTFGQWYARELTEANREMLYLPVGMAHGFLALTDSAVVCYVAGEVHSPPNDLGIAWNSFGMVWPVETPILAERDQKLPPLADFDSPF